MLIGGTPSVSSIRASRDQRISTKAKDPQAQRGRYVPLLFAFRPIGRAFWATNRIFALLATRRALGTMPWRDAWRCCRCSGARRKAATRGRQAFRRNQSVRTRCQAGRSLTAAADSDLRHAVRRVSSPTASAEAGMHRNEHGNHETDIDAFLSTTVAGKRT